MKLATGLILCMQTEVIETRNKDIIKDLGAVRLLVAGIHQNASSTLGSDMCATSLDPATIDYTSIRPSSPFAAVVSASDATE